MPLRARCGRYLATEDLISMLDGLGITTGVQLDGVITAAVSIEPFLGHGLPSRLVQALRQRRPPE